MIKITRHDYSSGQSECSSYYVLNGNYINATVKRQLKLLLLESYTHALILVKTRFRFHKHILVFLLVYFNLFFQYLWWGLEHLCAREAVYHQLTSTLPYFQCLFYFINQTFSCLFGMWGHGTYYVAHTWTQKDTSGSWFFSSTMRDLGKKSCCQVANAYAYWDSCWSSDPLFFQYNLQKKFI